MGIIILAIFGVVAFKYFYKTPVSKIEESEKVLATETTPLAKIINASMATASGTYGIVVKNLKTEETFVFNAQQIFESASIYKLWVMAAAFEQIQNGKFSEDDILSADVADLNKKFAISPEEAEETEGEISLSVREALYQMITISDNYAALLLTDKIGINAVSQFLDKNGLLESKVGSNDQNPVTTPADTAIFLRRLYDGKLANEQYTKEMTDFLKWQKLNDGLPKYLPEGTTVAHKTGELDISTHDAGIIYTDFGDYIIVIFSESDSREQAKEQIARISEAVYKYFSVK